MKQNKTITTRLGILSLLLAAVILGGVLWWQDGNSAVDPSDRSPVVFVIKRGDGVKTIASNLAAQNLIRSRTAFFVLVKILGIERNLQAGDFRLNQAMNAADIARELTHGFLDVWVTTLEGWRVEEVANRLAKDLDIPEAQFLAVAEEGYMFPDTYLIPRDASPAGIVQIFRDNFEKKFNPEMRSEAQKKGLTPEEAVILASLVEREGRTEEDRPLIAGILLKRWQAGWPLQADATLQYALGYQIQEKTWWKKSLTTLDKKIKSSYNTYLHPGLPPGPIANPGLSAIKAVIYPKESDYWFYLHDSAGQVHYARTIEEHEDNIANYLQGE